VFPAAARIADFHRRSRVVRMKFRSEINSSGRPSTGRRRRTVTLTSDCTQRPTRSRGASVVNRTAPVPTSNTTTAPPRYAAIARPRSTGAPPRMAGTARMGRARAVAIWRPVDGVSAAAASPPSTPALRSITTVNGVAEPGMIRPSAFPASCPVAIVNHPVDPNAIRSSSHRQIQLTNSKRSTRTAKGQSRCFREGHDDRTESRLGRSR
jgi:hypothetical protein